MILCDTGCIIAMVSNSDDHHRKALDLFNNIRPPVHTTLPCITEAMYMVGPANHPKLRQYLKSGLFDVPHFTLTDIGRGCDLMEQYADIPMDFADASLVVAAENLGTTKILTFDRHFYAYRIHGKTAFEVLA